MTRTEIKNMFSSEKVIENVKKILIDLRKKEHKYMSCSEFENIIDKIIKMLRDVYNYKIKIKHECTYMGGSKERLDSCLYDFDWIGWIRYIRCICDSNLCTEEEKGNCEVYIEAVQIYI